MTFMNIYYPCGNRFVSKNAFILLGIHTRKQTLPHNPKLLSKNVYNGMIKP